MKIHVFICNYNAGNKLKQTLDSLNQCLSYPTCQNVYISVVDNASKDNYLEILQPFNSALTILNKSNIGKAKALNNLIKQYSDSTQHIEDDDLIMSLDSDIYITQASFFDTLQSIWSILKEKVSCLVCFQTGNSLFKRKFEWTDSKKGFNYFCPSEGYGAGIAGGAIIIPYKYWKLVNGYDENKGIYGSNDGNLLYGLYNKTKKPICVIKELEVFHSHEENLDYQKWKDEAHKQQVIYGKCMSNGGFYD